VMLFLSIASALYRSQTFSRKFLAGLFLCLAIWSCSASHSFGQSAVTSPSSSDGKGWVARDPTSGRLYYQQLVPVSVPEVRWENKQVTTTVHRPELVSQVVNQQQTVMRPHQQTVLQPYWTGLWNPFQPPTLAYRYVPQTTWVPTQVSTPHVVTTQKMVPHQETITVAQPISETRTIHQLVQTEIPQANGPQGDLSTPRMAYTIAHQRPPVFPVPGPGSIGHPGTGPNFWQSDDFRVAALPPTGSPLPLAPSNQGSYSAPMPTSVGNSNSRDALQTGLRPTVLR
jgi:hypothetical protein